jgi:hypothetical protein
MPPTYTCLNLSACPQHIHMSQSVCMSPTYARVSVSMSPAYTRVWICQHVPSIYVWTMWPVFAKLDVYALCYVPEHGPIYKNATERPVSVQEYRLFFSLMDGCLTAPVVYWSEFLATDSEDRVRFLVLPDFLRSSGSGSGSTQPREYRWGATWKI